MTDETTVPEVSTYEHYLLLRRVMAETGAASKADWTAVRDRLVAEGVPGLSESSASWLYNDILKGEMPVRMDATAGEADAFLAVHTRPAALIRTSEDPLGSPLDSHLHGLPCLPAGSDWPVSEDGEPMRHLAWIDLDQAGVRPEACAATRFLAVFVPADEDEIWDCVPMVLEFTDAEGLAPLDAPEGHEQEDAVALSFERVSDRPALDDAYARLPEGFSPEDAWKTQLHDLVESRAPHHLDSKVGGWPSPIQDGVFPGLDGSVAFPPGSTPFVLQLGYDLGLEFGDAGSIYLAKGPLDYTDGTRVASAWTMDAQCY